LELTAPIAGTLLHGIGVWGSQLVTVSGDSDFTRITVIAPTGDTDYVEINGLYEYGPALADFEADGTQEVVLFTADGDGVIVSMRQPLSGGTELTVVMERSTGNGMTTNPIVTDANGDGFADVVVGGMGLVHAFDRNFVTLLDFPIEADDRYADSAVIATPISVNVSRGGLPEIIFPGAAENIYAYGLDRAFGFPLSSGRQVRGISGSSPVVCTNDDGGMMAYVGGDGWLYGYEVDADTTTDYWPMNGGGPAGHFSFDVSRLSGATGAGGTFSEERYFNYPNPVVNDTTVIRYYLDGPANSVTLNIYDMSGVRVDELQGTTLADADNEVVWRCDHVVPGVYRCVIEVAYPGSTESAYTDIAVVK
ncbi:T9SS type A sorting domain-containing protein, partial [candidate division GN15 bacterium]|nr:T9SS type A sorting domain-containing protein [candidate division GN15 bacterium]